MKQVNSQVEATLRTFTNNWRISDNLLNATGARSDATIAFFIKEELLAMLRYLYKIEMLDI